MRAGDVLVEVGGRKITSPEDVLDAAFYMSAEDELTLRVARGGEELELKLQPIDPPGTRSVPSSVLGSVGVPGGTAMGIER